MQPSPQGPSPPNERASHPAIALSLGHDPGRVRCRTRPPMMDLSCRTCTGGTSGGGRNQDVWLREPPQFRTLVRRAHATPGRPAGPHHGHALASKHGAGLLRLPAPVYPWLPAGAREAGGVACDDSLPPAAGEAACDSLPEAGEACDSLPHAGEEACDSESDSLLPHGDAATPHHDWLRASKHRTELRRHDATAPAIDPLPRNLSTNGADVCERGHTQTHASC